MSGADKPAAGMIPYKVGDGDTRPWGRYTVTAVGHNDVGEEFCEKEIIVSPGQVLSLQSHDLRRERWRVTEGALTVIVDDTQTTLQAGETIDVPQGAVHCMANLSNAPCTVHELQQGQCREEDIIRYMDAYGRAAAENDAEKRAAPSRALYTALLQGIGEKT